jgi:hypothetical protein
MSVRRLLVALSLAATLLVGPACVTPTIPIPPPEPERMTFEVTPDDGTATFRYDPTPSYADAVVYVFNRDTGSGVITTAEPDGSVAPTEPFAGVAGDDIVVSFELEGQLGTICVELADGRSSSANECVP